MYDDDRESTGARLMSRFHQLLSGSTWRLEKFSSNCTPEAPLEPKRPPATPPPGPNESPEQEEMNRPMARAANAAEETFLTCSLPVDAARPGFEGGYAFRLCRGGIELTGAKLCGSERREWGARGK